MQREQAVGIAMLVGATELGAWTGSMLWAPILVGAIGYLLMELAARGPSST